MVFRNAAPPVRGWGFAAVAALAASSAGWLWILVEHLRRLHLLDAIVARPGTVTIADADASDAAVSSAAHAVNVLYLLTVVAFIGFVFAAAKAVDRTRPGMLRHSTGWAIGAWFVPFLNLVRPKQIIDDVRSGSRPTAERESTALTSSWWGVLLASGVLWRICVGITPGTVGDLQTLTWTLLVADLLTLVAAALGTAVVLTTLRDWRQEAATPPPPVVAGWPGYTTV